MAGRPRPRAYAHERRLTVLRYVSAGLVQKEKSLSCAVASCECCCCGWCIAACCRVEALAFRRACFAALA